MITLEKACEIVKEKYPYDTIVQCWDYGEYYYFRTFPKRFGLDINSDNEGLSIEPFVYKEDGKLVAFASCEIDEVINRLYYPNSNKQKPCTEMDIIDFVSDDEVELIMKMRELKYDW